MALKLKMDTEYGVAVEYWRVGMREEHIVGRHLKVTMLGYLNEASAKGGKSQAGDARSRVRTRCADGRPVQSCPVIASLGTCGRLLSFSVHSIGTNCAKGCDSG